MFSLNSQLNPYRPLPIYMSHVVRLAKILFIVIDFIFTIIVLQLLLKTLKPQLISVFLVQQLVEHHKSRHKLLST